MPSSRRNVAAAAAANTNAAMWPTMQRRMLLLLLQVAAYGLLARPAQTATATAAGAVAAAATTATPADFDVIGANLSAHRDADVDVFRTNATGEGAEPQQHQQQQQQRQRQRQRARNELIASSANLLLEAAVQQHPSGHTVNLTRHHDGDVFRTNDVTNCDADTCVGLSSGTAGLVRFAGNNGGVAGGNGGAGDGGDGLNVRSSAFTTALAGGGHKQFNLLGKRGQTTLALGDSCQCRCLPYLSTYREDLGICVDDIHECTLSPFVSGSSAEKIPFVFLPLRGQIIYPSREISFPDIRTPVCAVTGAQYLSANGWSDLRNPIDTDYPFRMFRDEGRTFLQWLGEPDLRQKMQGRLIVVHLVCRDMMLQLNATLKDHLMPPKNVFSPCVAFRVNGSPVKYAHNVSEVLFQSETTATLASSSDGMTTKEYVVIGVCSLLLGLIYVSSVFLYLHMKKRKNRDGSSSNMRRSLDDLAANEINYPKNDQVTFGAPFNRSGSIYSAASLGAANEPRSRTSIGSLKDDLGGGGGGIVKNNPLLQHYPQLGEHHSAGFASDISASNSECEMDGGGGGAGSVGGPISFHDKLKQSFLAQMQTAALIHPQLGALGGVGGTANSSPKGGAASAHGRGDESRDRSSSPTQDNNECLPMENVAIVEDMMTEEKLENLRAMVNGNIRKKLYFNPAYFEPHLLAQPPPAAVEFLQKIREVIAIAKYKMATKRYQPSLIMIPEEGSLRAHTPASTQQGATPSGQQQQPHVSSSSSAECVGCANNRCGGHAKNCGDKRNSIEKWLQTVPMTEEQRLKAADATAATTAAAVSRHMEAAVGGKSTTSNGVQPERRPSPAAHNNGGSSSSNKAARRDAITPPKQRPPPPPTPTNSARSADGSFRHSASPPTQSAALTIPVNRSVGVFSSLSAAANIYGFAETGGEIYNNPKFTLHDSPDASTRSRGSSHRSAKSSRKRLDVLEQYAAASSTPPSLNSAERQHYEMLRNIKQMMPHSLLYDATGGGHSLLTNSAFQLDIPTPDYDSTIEKNIKDIYNNTQSSSGGAPSVPTPDYSTLSRRSLKQHCPQPDSPIYRRKSPQYLIVDYETDSLERLEAVTKRKSSHSSSSPSSDVSSQLSPSLSTALPLEEELEISHTVYDKTDGFRREGDAKRNLVTKSDGGASAGGCSGGGSGSNDGVGTGPSSQQKEMAARIKYDTPFRGSMTIEVEHEPQSDLERSTDSEQFEPDTLDRKPKKQSFCDAWSSEQLRQKQDQHQQLHQQQQQQQQQHCVADVAGGRYRSLDNLHYAPPAAALHSSSSFRLQPSPSSGAMRGAAVASPTYERSAVVQLGVNGGGDTSSPTFSSLREIYESPLMRQNSQQSCKCGGQAPAAASRGSTPTPSPEEAQRLIEQGRLLTLEAKHSRRQRVIESPLPQLPPAMQLSSAPKSTSNRTTIKITTPKVRRTTEAAIVEPQLHVASSTATANAPRRSGSKDFYDFGKRPLLASCKTHAVLPQASKKRAPPSPPPPPPPTSASTTLSSRRSRNAPHPHPHSHPHPHQHPHPHHYQNQEGPFNGVDDDTLSNHSESTEVTRVSDTMASNSEFDGSCNNTLSSVAALRTDGGCGGGNSGGADYAAVKLLQQHDSPQLLKSEEGNEKGKGKLKPEDDFGALFNTQINGLRGDYSLTKYMNRRKSQDRDEEEQHENAKNIAAAAAAAAAAAVDAADAANNRLEVLSISSIRSNRSSSRLSDRTKELYRNAGVPVGIAYPQRSSAVSGAPSPAPSTISAAAAAAAANVQTTVYRCEIEPVQLTHGMQIAMGLKDRAKKAKDLKNAWKKFVSMAASKFSPTQSPAPPFEKKASPASFLEALDQGADEGISSLIEEHAQQASSSAAPVGQSYYEQRFGVRPQEMDSGYMSADSSEVYKRSFYDRYNFRMMSGRDHIIRVDTIEDNSDGGGDGVGVVVGNTLMERHNGVAASTRRDSVLDSNRFDDRFEDFENMGDPPPCELNHEGRAGGSSAGGSARESGSGSGRHRVEREREAMEETSSDTESDKTLTRGSSETDGETNAEDMWESGAESIETHSVLYKNVRKN